MNSTMEAWTALIWRGKGKNEYDLKCEKHLEGRHIVSWWCYLSDVQQVDLQEEGGGARSHLLGRTTDGKAQLAA